LSEKVFQVRLGDTVGEVADIELCVHKEQRRRLTDGCIETVSEAQNWL
jgi:hypothetical protein